MSCENIESTVPLTQIQKRHAKIAELDKEDRELLHSHIEHCRNEGIPVNVTFLFENFGIGAGDAYNDEEIDAMVAQDETNEANKEMPTK
jgi:hypothetical protein